MVVKVTFNMSEASSDAHMQICLQAAIPSKISIVLCIHTSLYNHDSPDHNTTAASHDCNLTVY